MNNDIYSFVRRYVIVQVQQAQPPRLLAVLLIRTDERLPQRTGSHFVLKCGEEEYDHGVNGSQSKNTETKIVIVVGAVVLQIVVRWGFTWSIWTPVLWTDWWMKFRGGRVRSRPSGLHSRRKTCPPTSPCEKWKSKWSNRRTPGNRVIAWCRILNARIIIVVKPRGF